MRRAWVTRCGMTGEPWTVYHLNSDGSAPYYEYPTHAEALHAALEAVGLTPANPEPMEAP